MQRRLGKTEKSLAGANELVFASDREPSRNSSRGRVHKGGEALSAIPPISATLPAAEKRTVSHCVVSFRVLLQLDVPLRFCSVSRCVTRENKVASLVRLVAGKARLEQFLFARLFLAPVEMSESPASGRGVLL